MSHIWKLIWFPWATRKNRLNQHETNAEFTVYNIYTFRSLSSALLSFFVDDELSLFCKLLFDVIERTKKGEWMVIEIIFLMQDIKCIFYFTVMNQLFAHRWWWLTISKQHLATCKVSLELWDVLRLIQRCLKVEMNDYSHNSHALHGLHPTHDPSRFVRK